MTIEGPGGASLGSFDDYFTNIAIKSGHHSGMGHVWLSDPELAAQYPNGEMPLTELHDLTVRLLAPQIAITA